MNDDLLHFAVRFLAGRCDGAFRLDGAGYNKADTYFGHKLAELPAEKWTPRQRRYAWVMIRKYKKQLSLVGIEYEAIPVPSVVKGGEKQSDIRVLRLGEDSSIEFHFPFDPDLIRAVRMLPGRKYDPTRKVWSVPPKPQVLEPLMKLASEFDFEFEEGVSERLHYVDNLTPEPERFLSISKDSRWAELDFPYDIALIDRLRQTFPRAKFGQDGARKYWYTWLDEETAATILAFAQQEEFVFLPGAKEFIDGLMEQGKRKAELAVLNIEASRAKDAEFEVPGLGMNLYPFQKAGVKYVIHNAQGRCLLGDEMGLGKTPSALAVLQHLQAFPALIICPNSVKLNWGKEAARWLPHLVKNGWASVSIIDGNEKPIQITVDGRKLLFSTNDLSQPIIVINYDLLSRDLKGVEGRGRGKKVLLRDRALALSQVPFQAIIVDESQRVKSHKAQRTIVVQELAKDKKVRLLLSGTPIVNRPIELLSQLNVLGRLNDLGGFNKFTRRYCKAYMGPFGWDLTGAAHLDELNEKLRATCYVRRRKDEVLKELPPKRRVLVPVDITNRQKYEEVEADAISWYMQRAVEDEEFLASIEHLSLEDQKQARWRRMQDAAYRAQRAEHLTRINALKQVGAQGKLGAIIDWVTDFLENEEKLVLFADHIAIQKTIFQEFPDSAHIFGEDDAITRQANVDKFQTDPKCRLIICSLVAGGEGITLTAATNVVFTEFGWTPAGMEQAESRLHRIGQQGSVTAWWLVAENTIDEDITELIEKKRKVVEEATDGTIREQTMNESVVTEVIDRLIHKGKKEVPQ